MARRNRMGLDSLDPRPARFKALKQEGSMLLRCGWPNPAAEGKLCPGVLGIANDYSHPHLVALPYLVADGRGRWLLEKPRGGVGLREIEPGVFENIRPKYAADGQELPRRGRRKMIRQHQTPARLAKGGRWIKGATPSLPAIVICPRCGRPNAAGEPT